MLNSSSELKEEMLSFVSAEAQYYHDIKWHSKVFPFKNFVDCSVLHFTSEYNYHAKIH
jgi:hypothetical protein